MNSNKLHAQIMTMFGGLMSFFYGGVGLYIILSPDLINIDKVLRIIFGSSMILYGLYRLYRTYVKIIEVFFTKDDPNNKNEEFYT
jgi:hypothetical protein